jgi:hypothetical protein
VEAGAARQSGEEALEVGERMGAMMAGGRERGVPEVGRGRGLGHAAEAKGRREPVLVLRGVLVRSGRREVGSLSKERMRAVGAGGMRVAKTGRVEAEAVVRWRGEVGPAGP